MVHTFPGLNFVSYFLFSCMLIEFLLKGYYHILITPSTSLFVYALHPPPPKKKKKKKKKKKNHPHSRRSSLTHAHTHSHCPADSMFCPCYKTYCSQCLLFKPDRFGATCSALIDRYTWSHLITLVKISKPSASEVTMKSLYRYFIISGSLF